MIGEHTLGSNEMQRIIKSDICEGCGNRLGSNGTTKSGTWRRICRNKSCGFYKISCVLDTTNDRYEVSNVRLKTSMMEVMQVLVVCQSYNATEEHLRANGKPIKRETIAKYFFVVATDYTCLVRRRMDAVMEQKLKDLACKNNIDWIDKPHNL